MTEKGLDHEDDRPATPSGDIADPRNPTERWVRIKRLFTSALAYPTTERAAFLSTECGDDPEVLREVESLLESYEGAGDFIESPPAPMRKLLKGEPTHTELEVGNRIGAYQIVRELGSGGMGAVYLAVRADSEFEKRVAIKLIRRGMASEFVVRRFRNERQILARLEHANIARLIDGGSTEEGLPYFIMEYVEGRPITEYCDAHCLANRERLEILLTVCSAVTYAHERNIIHRDLKPTNILVKANGTAKLLDFGIAKLVDSDDSDRTLETTLAGFRMMTPAYASPEQLRGEPATIASDVFSLGVLLHELLCGRRPNRRAWPPSDSRRPGAGERTSTELPSNSVRQRTTAETIEAGNELTPELIAENRSTSPEVLSAELAGNLDRIILKAIQYDPAERYPSVEAFRSDIQLHLSGENISGTIHAYKKSIAVLPFRLLNSENDSDGYLGLALADAVITKLSNIRGVSVCATTPASRREGVDPIAAGVELGVAYLVEGRIHKSGDRVRIAVQLLSVRDHTSLWAAQFDERLDDFLKLEDSISGQIALALIPQLSGEVSHTAPKGKRANTKAYQAYLKGRWHWNQNSAMSLEKALQCFSESIAEDPDYASAHAGIAECYIWQGVYGISSPEKSFAAAKSSAAKALELDYTLADAHASLGVTLWVNDRDFRDAERELRLAIELNEDSASAHSWLGLLYSCLGRHGEAVECMHRARALDSTSPLFAARYALCQYHARDYNGALDTLHSMGPLEREASPTCELKAWIHLQRLESDEGLHWARRAVEVSERSSTALCVLASALCARGRQQEARLVKRELESRAKKVYVSSYLLGSIQHALGNKKSALDCFERAARDRDWWVLWVGVQPRFVDLRDERRFARLVRDLNLDRRSGRVTGFSKAGFGWTTKRLLGAAIAALVVIAVTVFLVEQFRPRRTPFQQFQIAKLTTNGIASRAAISPDGKYVAYVSNENGRQILWLRQVNATGSVRMATPAEADISRLAFSQDGLNLSFVAAPRNVPGHGVLYTVAVPGGTLRPVLQGVTGPASLSPDGARAVMIRADPANRQDNLYIAAADGSGEKLLATRHYPERFSWPSSPIWSHDGKLILCAVEGFDDRGFNVSLFVVRISDRTTKIIRNPRWQFIEQATWLGGDRGLVVVGRASDSSFQQIWYLPYPEGSPRRLTNDLSDFTGLTATSDSSAVVSVQIQTLTNVYVLRPTDPGHTVQITQGTGRYFDLSWSPRGEILYSSDASGTADIWSMNVDGSGQRQLTSGSGRNYAPAVSPDGESLVFHSNRGGNWNLWRKDLRGTATQQLTFGANDSNWPRFSPDGKWVFYHHTGTDGMWNIWRIPSGGGEAQEISKKLSMYPAVSPAISPEPVRIACWFSEDAAKPHWKLAVLAADSGQRLKLFNLPPTVFPDTTLRWTPDGKAIAFINNKDGASNVWIQPLEGGPSRAVTSFTWGQIYSFDWSKDGRLAYSRGLSTSDVVILRDTQN